MTPRMSQSEIATMCLGSSLRRRLAIATTCTRVHFTGTVLFIPDVPVCVCSRLRLNRGSPGHAACEGAVRD
jgi:hypothetical protein